MKITTIVSALTLMLFTSCGNSRTQDEHKPPPPPKALADKTFSDIKLSSRGEGDLVERLYDELSDKAPALKELENRLENLSKSENDSTAAFDKYDGKVQSYYSD